MGVTLEKAVKRRDLALAAAHRILESHEASASRVLTLRQSLKKLTGLPVDVAEYYREALKALEIGCYRASMVMAWAGFIHTLTDHLVRNFGSGLAASFPKWATGTVNELLEFAPEAQILEAAKKLGQIRSQTFNIYKGWLSTRNQCAHPTLFEPTRNVAIGFVDAMISEVTKFV